MLDVGGQRSERRKWIHCFENVTSVIFIVASSEFDQYNLVEEDNELDASSKVNRMEESLALFEVITASHYFRNTSFILFLNKQDLLEEKIKTSSLKKHFHQFNGKENDHNSAKEFILSLYEERKPANIDIFPHYTFATDTKNIQRVFDAVSETVTAEVMRLTGVSGMA